MRNGLTTSSSATAARPQRWNERKSPKCSWRSARRKQAPLALLGIRDRVLRVKITTSSVYRRLWRGIGAEPRTIGEHLRRKRVDMGLTNVELAHILAVAYQTVERWEHNRCPMKPKHRAKVVAFLGYDPESELLKPSS